MRLAMSASGTLDTPQGSHAAQPTPPLLTPEQVAELLGVTTRTVRRWARDGMLDRIELGRLVRFTPDAVAALIERNTESPRHAMSPAATPGSSQKGLDETPSRTRAEG